MTAGGVWIYTLDNSNSAVNALNTGQTLTDSFTVHTLDGTGSRSVSPSTAPRMIWVARLKLSSS